MSKIVRGGQSGSLDHIDSSQGTFRTQISALTDAVRQLGGNPEIGAGAVINDPLSAPYVLYVNPFTGSDTFVSGPYSTSGSATQRIELQRLECGYSESRPFKTINRAIIEAGIITAKSFYASPLANYDLVSIILAPGVYTALNAAGAASVSEWTDGKVPSDSELQAFNSSTVGGILLPRGVSLCGMDLRKTIIRPDAVPSVANEASNQNNRRSIFKVTGTGYYFGFTFFDKVGTTASHHLLHCFEFASQSELDDFYAKIRQAFGGANNTGGLDLALAVTRTAEYEITGPQPIPGAQTIATDTTTSASPYIFNCSIRSNYGLCGIFADGTKPTGFRSMVVAQFTGVSLQRDLSCWQKYAGTSWGSFADYDDYITTQSDNVRMHPGRRSFHVRATNNAIIQEVSVFAIGQGVHHWTESGGELTVTNSNSNFGGCAAISEGYRSNATPADTDWTLDRIKVAANLTDISNNVERIYLGTVASYNNSSITLETALGDSPETPGVPDILARREYTLRSNSRVWIENPADDDWSSTFTSSAWSSGSPTVLNINTALVVTGDQSPVGKRVYIRRLVDTRTPEQRSYTLLLNNTSVGSRTPTRDYVIQTITGGIGIAGEIANNRTTTVLNAKKTTPDGVAASAQISLRRSNASVNWSANSLYRVGDVVKLDGKHFSCIKKNSDAAFTPANWDEIYVHMPSDYNGEDFWKNETPIIIFDNDTSSNVASTTLGYNLSTVWSSDSLIRAQYRSATDYRGLHQFLIGIGFSSANAHTILLPKAEASRELDPSISGDMAGFVPGGAATALGNWPLEFRRPSVLRLFGHAWEWAGYLNYTKALPIYQKQLSAQNRFSYYFTNVDGGRCYGTGFNEEGFQVSPRGLEDITTGQTLSVESLGASDIDSPTTLRDLTLTGTTTINDTLDIQATSITFPDAARATTNRLGITELASVQALGIDANVSGNTNAARNADISSAPEVVTAKGLEYWRVHNRLLSQRTGVQLVYVDPVNGADITSIDDLLGAPPTSESSAVKTLTAAALYARSVFSPTETVEFLLGPGIYIEAGTISFTSITRIRAWDFGASKYLNNSKAGGTVPFMGQALDGKSWDQSRSTFVNTAKHPIFLTEIRMGWPYSPTRAFLQFRPLTLDFAEDATVTGVVWWGTAETITNNNVPDSFFTSKYPANIPTWRANAKADVDNALNHFIKSEIEAEIAGTGSSSVINTGVALLQGFPCIRARKTLQVQNVAFDAISPAETSQYQADAGSRCVIETSGEPVIARGLWLIGNVNISSDLPSPPKLRGQTTYQVTGFCTSIFNIYYQTSPNDGITLNLGGFREVAGGDGADADYNFTWNNIHLVRNNLAYPGAANDTSPTGSNWKNVGPAIQGFLGQPFYVATTLEIHWHDAFLVSAVNYQGFAGKFGNYGVYNNASLNARARGIDVIRDGFEIKDMARYFFLRKAGTADVPPNSGYPALPGEIGAQEDFDALNAEVTPILKGIDVNKPLIAAQSIKL